MTGDVLAQIEAVLQQVAERTEHAPTCCAMDCPHRPPCPRGSCDCDRGARVWHEQARTVERIGNMMARAGDEGMCTHERSDAAEERWWNEAWAAALRATEQGET